MSPRNRNAPPSNFESERTLADAESEESQSSNDSTPNEAAPTQCVCGHEELLLQAFFSVANGVLGREPIEIEGLTCPSCEREFEAIVMADGTIGRGAFVGFANDEE